MLEFAQLDKKALFTIVVIPDTQKYCEKESLVKVFDAQINWIIENKSKLNIKFATHVGDVVQNDDIEEEYSRGFKVLNKLKSVIDYGISAGNHDMHIGGKADLFEKYYNINAQKNLISSYNSSKNSAFSFSFHEYCYMMLHIEFAPSDNVLKWASDIIKSHPHHRVMLTNHGFLTPEEDAGITTRTSRLSICDKRLHREGNNAGIEIYKKIILPNPNVFIVFSGHYYSQRTMKIKANRIVYAMQSDYNLDKPYSGNGWMRVLQFVKQDNAIYVYTYSPFLNKFKESEQSNFKLNYDFATGLFI